MKHISAAEFRNSIEQEKNNPFVDFINVCTPTEFNEQHIPGARNVPLDELEAHLNELGQKKTIYVHCNSGNRSQKAIEKLSALGVTAELINLSGGIQAWNAAGHPTNSNTTRMPLMRQVMLTAGSLVVLGVVLGLTINPNFIFVSLFVGGGLMFSGLTGWCGMSILLSRMPWNK